MAPVASGNLSNQQTQQIRDGPMRKASEPHTSTTEGPGRKEKLLPLFCVSPKLWPGKRRELWLGLQPLVGEGPQTDQNRACVPEVAEWLGLCFENGLNFNGVRSKSRTQGRREGVNWSMPGAVPPWWPRPSESLKFSFQQVHVSSWQVLKTSHSTDLKTRDLSLLLAEDFKCLYFFYS